MNFENINKEITSEKIILRPISTIDRDFINNLFQDDEIFKYYIVPKEAQQDYRKLVDYWLNDIKNGAGTCWVICKKDSSTYTKEEKCGFIAFEFRDSLKNARISYALHPVFRKKGIATDAITHVINILRNNDITRIEADIDRDNSHSERLVEKLGFKANKEIALVDPEMMRNGEIRLRTLWKKELIEISRNFESVILPIDATIQIIVPLINKIVEEINFKGQQPLLILNYYYLLGRIKFLEENYEEAREAFGNCNMIISKEKLPDNHEFFYWLGRINAIESNYELAKTCFTNSLKRFNNGISSVTEEDIQNAIISVSKN